MSYPTVLKWMRCAAEAVGAGQLDLTTHSLRRSGASELLRLGCPWPEIMQYGRWNSDRAAREYARKREVAVYRARNDLPANLLSRAAFWNGLSSETWIYAALIHTAIPAVRRRAELTPARVTLLDKILRSGRVGSEETSKV